LACFCRDEARYGEINGKEKQGTMYQCDFGPKQRKGLFCKYLLARVSITGPAQLPLNTCLEEGFYSLDCLALVDFVDESSSSCQSSGENGCVREVKNGHDAMPKRGPSIHLIYIFWTWAPSSVCPLP